MSISRQRSDATDSMADGAAGGAADHATAIPYSGFLRSFSFAGQGVWYVVRTQRNMRVHLLAAAAAIAAGLVLRIGVADWACVLAAIGLVLTAETLNTVVEALTDLYTTEYHPLAKVARLRDGRGRGRGGLPAPADRAGLTKTRLTLTRRQAPQWWA
jgi:diacylglycerol kinase